MLFARRSLLFVIFVIGLNSFPVQAQDQFALLKTINIDLRKKRQIVDMRQVRGAFSALRFRARRGQISLVKVSVVSRAGRTQVVSRRINVSPGRLTRPIVLRPSGQQIVRLILEYIQRPGRRAILEIQGRRIPNRAKPAPVARSQPGAVRTGRVDRRAIEARRRAESERRRRPVAKADRRATDSGRSATKQRRESVQAPTEEQRRAIESRRRAEQARQRATAEARRRSQARQPGAATRRPQVSSRRAVERSRPTGPTVARRESRGRGQPNCVREKTCTLVRIFFGTNRERDPGTESILRRVSFGSRRKEAESIAEELTLGRAIVTVPRAVSRRAGDIARPGFLEGFWDRYVRGVTPEGDPSRHFVIVREGFELYTTEAAFLQAVAAHMAHAGKYRDHAFVFVHGYNTKFDHALFRTAQIAYDLGEPSEATGVFTPFGTPFLYSWPSAGGELYYPYDQESARFAVAHLKTFLDLIVARSGAKKIHLIAHSMGNVPLLNALAEVAAAPPSGASIDQVILAAPDMDAAEFRRLASKVRPIAKGFTMYSSASDAAMDVSRTLHNGLPRAGDVITGKPTIASGVHTIDISEITTCYFCTGHSEYVEQLALLNDISALLRIGLRPPHERNETLRLESLDGSRAYWRYRP